MISKIQLANVNSKNTPFNKQGVDNKVCTSTKREYSPSFCSVNYPNFLNRPLNKNISFSGNYNPLVNYQSTTSAILNTDYQPLNVCDEANMPINKYVAKTVSELFRSDRKFLNRSFTIENEDFDVFGKIGVIKLLYKNGNYKKETATTISEYLKNNNLRPIEKKYLDFYENNLQSVEKVTKGEQKYSTLFLEKEVGNKNLVDFWLEKLDVNEIPKNDEDKINLLNNKLNENFKDDTSSASIKLLADTLNLYFLNEIKEQNEPIQETPEKNHSQIKTIEILKNKLTKIVDSPTSEQKEEFAQFIKDEENIKIDINGKALIDILLLPLEKEGIDVKDIDKNTKKEYLLEIARDNNLRTESIENALTIIRKTWMVEKAEEEKAKFADNAMKEEDLNNFNQQLIKKIFTQNSKEDSVKILNDIKLFEKEATKAFMNMIPQELFKYPNSVDINLKENANVILSLASERINTVKSNGEVNEIYKNADDLAEALHENSFDQANEPWENLVKLSLAQWKEKHLPKIIQTQQQDYVDVKNFLKSPMAKEVENINIINTIFKSENITIEEKAFLAKKAESKEGYDLCKFLSEHVPNNNSRQRIINNLIENEKISYENFDYLKDEFVKIIREQDTNNPIVDKKIQKELFVDLFLQQTPYANTLYSMSKSEKLAVLNKYPNEELNILAQEVKEKFMVEKSKEAFEEESSKYDLAPRFDKVMKNLEYDVNGKKYGLLDFISDQNSQLYKLIKDSNATNQQQMQQVMTLLSKNNAQANEIRAMLGIVIDRIQASHPQYAQQCRKARTFLQKLKDGLINPSTAIAGYGIWASVAAGAKSGAVVGSMGGPGGAAVGASLGALAIPLFIIATNLYNSFSRL